MQHPIFILLIIVGLSCVKAKPPINTYTPVIDTSSNDQGDSLRTYLALGDSYTIGQSVSESERFPAQITSILKQQGTRISNPVYLAQTGWTTANLQQAIAGQNYSTFNVVTLLIGVNDQYQKIDTNNYALRFTQLLDKAILLAKGKKTNVFVLSIPDYSVTPFVAITDKSRVSMEIDLFNAINKRITLMYGISYTDITPSTRMAATNPSLIAADNLHPSGSEYRKWAEMMVPKMKAVL